MSKPKRNDFSRSKIDAVFNKTGGVCFYCGCALPADTEFYDGQGKVFMRSRNWHIDHVMPYSKGGTHHIDNLVPSCTTCNLQKHDKTDDEFIAVRAR